MTKFYCAIDPHDTDYVHIYSELLGTPKQHVAKMHIDFLDDIIPRIDILLVAEGEAMIELSGEIIPDEDDPDAGYDPRTEALTIGERNLGLAGGPR